MTQSPVIFGSVLGFAFGTGVLLVIWRLRARTVRFHDRISAYLGPRATTSDLLREARVVTPFPVVEQFLAPWVKSVGRLLERLGSSRANLEARLLRAGTGRSIEQFRVQQILSAVLGLAGGTFFAVTLRWLRHSPIPALVMLVMLSAVIGVLLNDHVLSRQIKKRESRMMLEFPTIAELFALAVGAGQSPAAALDRVCATASGEVVVELKQLLYAVHSGTPFVRGLEELAATTSLPALARFAEGVAVAVERGTPLADVLRDQAQDVRDAGRRALMELGGQKEVAMMVPVVFLLLPITVAFAVFPSAVTLHIGL